MSVTDTTWTCPACGRSVVVYASEQDTACCIRAVQERHATGHRAVRDDLTRLGHPNPAARPRR